MDEWEIRVEYWCKVLKGVSEWRLLSGGNQNSLA